MNNIIKNKNDSRIFYYFIFKLTIFLMLLMPVFFINSFAEIQFSDATKKSGFSYVGKSYGSSWGDFNGDGWADLWTVNHGAGPFMYENNQNGTFSDVSKNLGFFPNKGTDPHGSAWGDFDNDGDQDLIVLKGGGGLKGNGTIVHKNAFFVNDSGNFIDKAETFGIDYQGARGRTPLWFDFNNDGYLDILFVNANRVDNSFPTTLFQNKIT